MPIHKPSIYWFSFFIVLVLLTTLSQPVNAHDKEESSKQKYFGVGGWFLGKDCPNIELYWVTKGDSEENYISNVFFRNSSGSVFKLSEGMATFNSSCKYFWHTGYASKQFQIFDKETGKPIIKTIGEYPARFRIYSTKTGKPLITTMGEYPAWSLDGKSVYFFRTKKTSRQLWKLNVIDKSENLITEVKDYLPCFQQGDEVEWYPVIITKEGHVLWSYWVKGTDGDYTNSAKKIFIDAKGSKVIRIEHADQCACSAFEENIEGPTSR